VLIIVYCFELEGEARGGSFEDWLNEIVVQVIK
jgi:hypothetical protein